MSRYCTNRPAKNYNNYALQHIYIYNYIYLLIEQGRTPRLGFLSNRVTVMEQLGPALIQIGLINNSDTLQDDLFVTFTTSDIVGI